MSQTPTAPFASNAEYLQEEIAYIKLLATRIDAEKKLDDARKDEEEGDGPWLHRPGRLTSRDLRCRILSLGSQIADLRGQTDARLEGHRAGPSNPELGIDRLCREHALTPEERLVLLALCIPCISREVADHVLGSLPTYYNALSAGNLAQLLGPANIGDWLRLRQLFRPNSTLRRSGLIAVNEGGADAGPQSLMLSEARLSLLAFSIIVGDPAVLAEVPSGAAPAGTPITTMN